MADWWVYSEEDDGQVIKADTVADAVKKWAASAWTDVEDGMRIEAYDIGAVQHFMVRQTNEIADDDLETYPEFEITSGSRDSQGTDGEPS